MNVICILWFSSPICLRIMNLAFLFFSFTGFSTLFVFFKYLLNFNLHCVIFLGLLTKECTKVSELFPVSAINYESCCSGLNPFSNVYGLRRVRFFYQSLYIGDQSKISYWKQHGCSGLFRAVYFSISQLPKHDKNKKQFSLFIKIKS